MKRLLLTAILLYAVAGCNPATAVERPVTGLELEIVDTHANGTIAVALHNRSSSPLRIWDDANSWGAGRWRVLLVRKRQVFTFHEDPDQSFTRNGPGFSEIAPGGRTERTLDLNDERWRGAGNRRIESGDVVIVLYDVPLTDEAAQYRVWYGVASAFQNTP